jgi:hypothetical protein
VIRNKNMNTVHRKRYERCRLPSIDPRKLTSEQSNHDASLFNLLSHPVVRAICKKNNF